MYRLILLTSLFAFGQCCVPTFPKNPCRYPNAQFQTEAREFFLNSAELLYRIDKMSNAFCFLFGENEVQVHGADSYKLLVAAPEDSGPFNVSLHHTVVFIRGAGTGCSSLSHMKFLPSYVDARKASWTLKNNAIIVTVPYLRREGGYKKCMYTVSEWREFMESSQRAKTSLIRYLDETKV